MAVIKTDTFTVGTNTTLDSHTSDTGGGWQGSQDFALTALATTDDVQCVSGIRTVIGDEINTETDYFAEIEGTLGGVASTDRIGVVMRSDGDASQAAGSSTYYVFRMEGASGWYLYRVESGSQQSDGFGGTPSDATYIADEGIDTDDPIKMKITVTGTTTVSIKLEIDQNIDGGGFGGYTTVYDNTDTDSLAIETVGDPGLYMRDANTRITYFNAEDLTTGGTSDVSFSGSNRGIMRGVGRGVG